MWLCFVLLLLTVNLQSGKREQERKYFSWPLLERAFDWRSTSLPPLKLSVDEQAGHFSPAL